MTEKKDSLKPYTPERLRKLIHDHGMSRRFARNLIRATRDQFDKWTLPTDSSSHRPMPWQAWELLNIKINEVEAERRKGK